ncbi:MAG TPA: hypothetical protein VL651_15530 [Bacteroidia bacterium]|nr:hypothetical protein [Bacteroidia bacterium]
MKAKRNITGVIAIVMFVIGMISCGKPDPFKTGTHCAAKWTDGSYWGATITGNTGGKYQIRYDDGTTGEVMLADLKSMCAKEDIKAGDKVLAVWSVNGKMYNGTVQDIQATGATIKWDDGSTPTVVQFSNITK